MAINETPQHSPKAVEISLETQALVEQKIPHASEEVKQKTMEIMEAIKQQFKMNLEKVDGSSDEAHLD